MIQARKLKHKTTNIKISIHLLVLNAISKYCPHGVIKFGLSSKHKIQEKLRFGLVLMELYCFALYIYLTAIKNSLYWRHFLDVNSFIITELE